METQHAGRLSKSPLPGGKHPSIFQQVHYEKGPACECQAAVVEATSR